MRFAHRLVIVLGLWGALILMLYSAFAAPSEVLRPVTYFIPGIVAAVIVYPIAWLFSGLHQRS